MFILKSSDYKTLEKMIFHFYFYFCIKKELRYNPPLAIVHVDKAQEFVFIECYVVTNLNISTRLDKSLQGFIEIANITRHLFIYDFWHKRICKGSSFQKGKILLTFVEIWAPNFWETIYCPNHWLTITNTQKKVFFFGFFLQFSNQ